MYQPSPPDIAASEILETAAEERVKTIRTRAEKWVPGLTAITGLVGTALVVKGPDSFSKISGEATILLWGPFETKHIVAWLIALALTCLIVGTFAAYTAAFGSALYPDTLDPSLENLGIRYANWKVEAEKKARFRLRGAVILTIAAAVALALAVGVATFVPSAASPTSVCLYRDGQLVVQLPAPAQVEALPEGTEIGECQ